jgi:hypothetical protein
VLIVAAAARAKVRAGGRDPLRRGGNNFIGLGGRVASLALGNAHPRLFAGQGDRHKDGFALDARQKRAAINRLLDLDKLRRSNLGLGDLGCGRLHCWLM